MRVLSIIQEQLGDGMASMHSARRTALFAAVAALLRDGRLPLSRLGRAMAEHTDDKHGIKRIDRLLGNKALHDEIACVHRSLTRHLLSWWQRPIILVDWTEAGMEMCVLSAALAFNGRSIVLWSEAHPESKLSNPVVESEFLLHLKAALPDGCRPIIVTDAGFHVPWLRKVQALGWDYVGRVRGRVFVRPSGDEAWIQSKEVFARATAHPRSLGQWDIVRSQNHRCRMVVFDGRSPRAKAPPRNIRRRIPKQRAAESAREPWILVTSLSDESARRIVNIYKTRMQIELVFRDIKSHRFGWSFEDVRTRDPNRINVFVLLATLASFVALLVGLAAESSDEHRGYQANTIRHRRVLSLVSLGRRIIERNRLVGSLFDALRQLRWSLLRTEMGV